jgi:hypothetical protein
MQQACFVVAAGRVIIIVALLWSCCYCISQSLVCLVVLCMRLCVSRPEGGHSLQGARCWAWSTFVKSLQHHHRAPSHCRLGRWQLGWHTHVCGPFQSRAILFIINSCTSRSPRAQVQSASTAPGETMAGQDAAHSTRLPTRRMSGVRPLAGLAWCLCLGACMLQGAAGAALLPCSWQPRLHTPPPHISSTHLNTGLQCPPPPRHSHLAPAAPQASRR